MLNIPILYQDKDIAVVVKPANLVVNRAQTVTEPTLQDWWEGKLVEGVENLRTYLDCTRESWVKTLPASINTEYGSPEEIFLERGGIVHRLDKETSGVMVLAKHPGSLLALLEQFKQRQVSKMYVCLVHGKFQISEDTLSLPLGRSSFNRTKFTVEGEGRMAETKYQVQEFYPELNGERVIAETKIENPRNLRKKFSRGYQGFSLVHCWPKTGRTHQIRVHMAHIKHPIVADETYLGKKRAALDVIWCPRLFLHAQELSFTHPRTGEPVNFVAPLPADLEQALKFLTSGAVTKE